MYFALTRATPLCKIALTIFLMSLVGCTAAARTPDAPLQVSQLAAANVPTPAQSITLNETPSATSATAIFAGTREPDGFANDWLSRAHPSTPPAASGAPALLAPFNSAAPPAWSGIGRNVWFMAPSINYFSKLGAYPPEAITSRPANANPLTGLQVADATLLQRRPLLARIGNDASARPQTGLNQADLVFEELIDQRNGVFATTRFTAVFLGQNGTIRPFRSARPVNASLTPMFDGALAHSGASKDTRYLLSKLPWTRLNLDDLFAPAAYCTIGSGFQTRFASTVQHLQDYLTARGLEKAVPLRGFDFDAAPASGTPVKSIGLDHLPWPIGAAGTTVWSYDATAGRYYRYINGAAHNTLQYGITPGWGRACSIAGSISTTQVSAANVVVLDAEYQPTNFIEDSNNFASAFVELTGSGVARIYRDGVQITATWRRPTLQHFFQFVDASGNTITLKPGNTWFEIAPLNYAPTVRLKYGGDGSIIEQSRPLSPVE